MSFSMEKFLYNFVDGYDPNGETTYDIWKRAGFEGGPGEFLEFMRTGQDGLSAYDIWKLQEGNENKTVKEFLLSSKGDQGPKGDTGVAGPIGPTGLTGPTGISIASIEQTSTSTESNGENIITATLSNGAISRFSIKNGNAGKSAYQTWLDLGNSGTESDFLNSLKGSGTGGVVGDVSWDNIIDKPVINVNDTFAWDGNPEGRTTIIITMTDIDPELTIKFTHLTDILPEATDLDKDIIIHTYDSATNTVVSTKVSYTAVSDSMLMISDNSQSMILYVVYQDNYIFDGVTFEKKGIYSTDVTGTDLSTIKFHLQVVEYTGFNDVEKINSQYLPIVDTIKMDDNITSSSSVWSSNKVNTAINAAKVTVNDTLTSTSTTQALSANQGKELDLKINKTGAAIHTYGSGSITVSMYEASSKFTSSDFVPVKDNAGFIRVSDKVPTIDDLTAGFEFTMSNGYIFEPIVIPPKDLIGDDTFNSLVQNIYGLLIVYQMCCVIVPTDNFVFVDNITFPKKGTYLMCDISDETDPMFVSAFRINGYSFDQASIVSGGSVEGGSKVVSLPQAEYDALSSDEQNNGSVYLITD